MHELKRGEAIGLERTTSGPSPFASQTWFLATPLATEFTESAPTRVRPLDIPFVSNLLTIESSTNLVLPYSSRSVQDQYLPQTPKYSPSKATASRKAHHILPHTSPLCYMRRISLVVTLYEGGDHGQLSNLPLRQSSILVLSDLATSVGQAEQNNNHRPPRSRVESMMRYPQLGCVPGSKGIIGQVVSETLT
ncbi:hypothetical protein P691DRAFT_766663 [Macrolepiota fuliginosa MF-IS2]|uniref:Uncharacterized protein n=1 Tax=Macrolepiota fuliginosa MF-IS2 TaxID=1400762 RepID=A0A9P6BVV0_9AGAR|nr:hypothetical protein P691DRAFT_766663 [Macrolepiota fuliginosa MF-IS2]